MDRIFIDTFDHDTDEPKGLSGVALDKHVLSTSKRISCFWIEENTARARRVTKWIKSGQLKLDNSCGYPWYTIKRFSRIDLTAAETR